MDNNLLRDLGDDVAELCKSVNYVTQPYQEAMKIAEANQLDEEYCPENERWTYLVKEIEPGYFAVMAYDELGLYCGPVSPLYTKKRKDA